jgi:hypothetical protein
MHKIRGDSSARSSRFIGLSPDQSDYRTFAVLGLHLSG